MTEKVLLFNFKGEQLEAVNTVLFLTGTSVREVKREEYGMSLQMLAEGKELPPMMEKNQRELDGQMMVFAGLPDEKLDQLLSILRSNPACGKIPYKAVMTKINREWNPLALFSELKREHASFAHQRK